jgi:hypothetical protein
MYSFFDQTVVLTLREQTDRQTHVKNTLEKLNIPFEFYYAERMEDPKLGSLDSHSKIILQALHSGSQNVLIFEDDVVPSNTYDESIINHCIEFMKSDDTWDMFYLGYCHPNPRTYGKDALKCGFGKKHTQYIYDCYCFCLHAYVVSKRGMIKYKELYEKELKFLQHPDNIDVELQNDAIRSSLNIYMCVPGQFDQLWCGLSSVKDLASKMCKFSQTYDHVELSYMFIDNRALLVVSGVWFLFFISYIVVKLGRHFV